MKRFAAFLVLLCLFLSCAYAETWVVPEGYSGLVSDFDDWCGGEASILNEKPGLSEITLPASMTETEFHQFMRELRAMYGDYWYNVHIYHSDSYAEYEEIEILPDYYAPGFSLEKIHIAPAHPTLCSVDGVVFTKDMKTLLACPPARRGSYTAPQGVTTIADEAFAYCDALEKISLPIGVEAIGTKAFYAAAELRSINLPPTMKVIGERAFYNCIGLDTLSLPAGVQVQEMAFKYLFGLKTLFAAEDVHIIGEDALRYVNPHTIVYCPEGSDLSNHAAVAQLNQAPLCGEPTKLRSPAFLYDNPAILTDDYEALCTLDTVNVLAVNGDMAYVDFCGEEITVPVELLSFADPYAGCERLLEARCFGDYLLYCEPRIDAETKDLGYIMAPIIQRFGTWLVVQDDEGGIWYLPAETKGAYYAANNLTPNMAVLRDRGELLDENGVAIAVFYPGEQFILVELVDDTIYARFGELYGVLDTYVWNVVTKESFTPGF